MNKGIASG